MATIRRIALWWGPTKHQGSVSWETPRGPVTKLITDMYGLSWGNVFIGVQIVRTVNWK